MEDWRREEMRRRTQVLKERVGYRGCRTWPRVQVTKGEKRPRELKRPTSAKYSLSETPNVRRSCHPLPAKVPEHPQPRHSPSPRSQLTRSLAFSHFLPTCRTGSHSPHGKPQIRSLLFRPSRQLSHKQIIKSPCSCCAHRSPKRFLLEGRFLLQVTHCSPTAHPQCTSGPIPSTTICTLKWSSYHTHQQPAP